VLALALGTRIHAASTLRHRHRRQRATPAAERTYPSVLPLTLEVSGDTAHELRTLRDLTITVQREGEYGSRIVIGPVDPFTDENTCTRPMPEGIAGCVVNGDATVGTLRVHWRVPEAGTYRFILSGKRGVSDRRRDDRRLRPRSARLNRGHLTLGCATGKSKCSLSCRTSAGFHPPMSQT
jgi:hypothetical protein